MVGHCLTGIPGPPETADRLASRRRKVFGVEREEGFELVQMNIFLLLIDVPQHWPPCPLRADKGIFAAYGVEITAPEQMVVLVLSDERQYLHGQGIAYMQRPDLQVLHIQPALDIPQDAPLRHQQMSGRRIAGQCVQPTGQAGIFIGKQRNQ
ncbi:hypothetical protein D3C76_1029790 [compost metagenome]